MYLRKFIKESIEKHLKESGLQSFHDKMKADMARSQEVEETASFDLNQIKDIIKETFFNQKLLSVLQKHNIQFPSMERLRKFNTSDKYHKQIVFLLSDSPIMRNKERLALEIKIQIPKGNEDVPLMYEAYFAIEMNGLEISEFVNSDVNKDREFNNYRLMGLLQRLQGQVLNNFPDMQTENYIRMKIREQLESKGKTKEQFFQENNIDGENLSWLGKGDFGNAYSTGDGRVLKITSSDSEFEIAKELEGQDSHNFDGFVKIYKTDIVAGEKYILMEELEEDSRIEDLYYELESLLSDQGLPMQYLDHLDTDELEISEELQNFINDIYSINHSYRCLGIEASDLRPENMGRDKEGNVKAFDIEDRRRTRR